MNNDIRPPKRPSVPPVRERPIVPPVSDMAADSAVTQELPAIDIDTSSKKSAQTGLRTEPKQRHVGKWIGRILAVLIFLGLCAAGGGVFWYVQQLKPVDSTDSSRARVTVASGMAPSQIAQLLEEKGVIRSAAAFTVYTRLHNMQNKLQAGVFSLSPSETTAAIVRHLVAGKTDEFSLTFFPGATLRDTTATDSAKKMDVTSVLLRAGYSSEEITAALGKTYDSPLFQDKPESADLEGYIYGETYTFNSGASVEDILQATFSQFYSKVKQNNLIEGFKAQGLTLYQGITLASIVQRESIGGDEAQIAQVFYLRLKKNMPLGSDVTYQYIADKTGVARDVNLDSPYNTRRYAGLPPGPIAVPGIAALKAAAKPAEGDYLYFLSGDDDVTYFGRTNEDHEANIRNHCQKKCQIL